MGTKKKKRNAAEAPSGYLDDEEDDDPFGEDERGVLSKFGSSSLHSRLAAQRQREEQRRKEQERAQGYISKVGNAIGWGASWIGL